MPLFLDACALAKRYVHEGRSTSRMRTITGRPNRWGGLVVSSFIEIEVVSAIARAAREYGNPMLRPRVLREVPRTVDVFLKEFHGGTFNIVHQTDDLLRSGIAELRGNPHHEIGAADALHLASALEVVASGGEPLVFVTADRGLYDAAKGHGLAVYNPNTEDEDTPRETHRPVACPPLPPRDARP
jgi:predicted nucleic acid-binding protein